MQIGYKMNKIEMAKAKASELVVLYPNIDNVQDLIATAQNDGHFANNAEMMTIY